MDLNTIRDAVVACLQPLQVELNLIVEGLPKDIGEVATERIWVAFKQADLSAPVQIRPILQDVILEYEIIFRIQDIQSESAANTALDRSRALLSGFIVPFIEFDPGGFINFVEAYVSGERFIDQVEGFWIYSQSLKLPCIFLGVA